MKISVSFLNFVVLLLKIYLKIIQIIYVYLYRLFLTTLSGKSKALECFGALCGAKV